MTSDRPAPNTGDPGTVNPLAVFSFRQRILLIAGLGLLLLAVASVALAAGAYDISLADVYGILIEHLFPFLSGPERERVLDTIVWNVRMPRILMAIVVKIISGLSNSSRKTSSSTNALCISTSMPR